MILLDIITVALMILGAFFGMVAGVGIVRMPDLYMRMQSATKAGTLGIACIVMAAAVHFQSTDVVVNAVLTLLFLFATAPIASHLIARAAYDSGVPLWDRTREEMPEDSARPAQPDPDADSDPASAG